MKKPIVKSLFIFILSCLLGLSANALKLQSACYYNVSTNQHADIDPNKRIEIASLSKILTSHWAIAKLGLTHRFITKLHVIPVDGTRYDLHFEGGFDPVFSRDRLQYVIALLNNNKISQLRKITFDENFIFIDNLEMVASSNSYPHDPNSARTKNNLAQALSKYVNSYSQTRRRAMELYRMNLPETLKLKFAGLAYQSKESFQADSISNERVIEIQSIPLKEILFEMNQHSNNHIADFLFQYLGLGKDYVTFAQTNLNTDLQNFDIRNGSGNPILDSAGKKFYNSASCSMIIEALLNTQILLGKSSLGLEAIYATAGAYSDPASKGPVSSNYSSAITDHAVIAKTGTIDPTIGLAGSLLTRNGVILFAILYGTRGPNEWKAARRKILEDISAVIQDNGAHPLANLDQVFLSFDQLTLKKN